jgi:hypothetical protein
MSTDVSLTRYALALISFLGEISGLDLDLFFRGKSCSFESPHLCGNECSSFDCDDYCKACYFATSDSDRVVLEFSLSEFDVVEDWTMPPEISFLSKLGERQNQDHVSNFL